MRNTRAFVMIAVALVLALVAVVVAAHWITDQGAATNKKVAVALIDIPLGARVTPEMVNMVEWPSNAMPPGAISDPKQLDTRVTRTAMERGEPIMESKLAPPGTTGGLSAVVAQGKRAMTVRVNDVVGVAGFALPGNFVDILVNTQEEARSDTRNNQIQAREQAISKIVLERILVLAVAQESNRDDTKPKVVNAVTLELTPDQVEKLDLARSVGTLSLVLRNQIDPKTADTAGATKESLLDPDGARAALLGRNRPAPLQQSVAKSPSAAPAPVPHAPAPRGDKVEVIKGLDRRTQQF